MNDFGMREEIEAIARGEPLTPSFFGSVMKELIYVS